MRTRLKALKNIVRKPKPSRPRLRLKGAAGRGLSFTQGLFTHKTLTLSIEGTTLRVLACEGEKVSAWTSLPFNPALLRNGFVFNSKGMAQVIRNALDAKGLHHKKVVAALPGFQSLSRIITLPKGKGVRPKVVLPGEAVRLMRISTDNSYLFWQAAGNTEQQRFFVLAVPKEPLLSFVETLRLAGLRSAKIDLKPLALARAVNDSDAIIVNAENNSIDIVVVVDSIPVVTRSIFLGEESLSLESASSRVVEELGRTIAFYNDTNRDNPLAQQVPIYLCGAFAADPELPSMVLSEIGHPMGQPKLVLDVPLDFPIGQMMVNLGLVLKGM